jgi:hypothetical protein
MICFAAPDKNHCHKALAFIFNIAYSKLAAQKKFDSIIHTLHTLVIVRLILAKESRAER